MPFLCFSLNSELPFHVTSGLSVTSAQTGSAHWLADAVYPSGIQQVVFGTSRLKSMLCAVSTVRLSATGTRPVRDQVRTVLLDNRAETEGVISVFSFALAPSAKNVGLSPTFFAVTQCFVGKLRMGWGAREGMVMMVVVVVVAGTLYSQSRSDTVTRRCNVHQVTSKSPADHPRHD